jgi:hypothetical protein
MGGYLEEDGNDVVGHTAHKVSIMVLIRIINKDQN